MSSRMSDANCTNPNVTGVLEENRIESSEDETSSSASNEGVELSTAMRGMFRGARDDKSSQPVSVTTRFSSCTIIRSGSPGRLMVAPGSIVMIIPGRSGVSSFGVIDAPSVRSRPRQCPERPVLVPSSAPS